MKQKTLQQHMQEIAIKGGKSTFKKHGKKHYVNMAKTAWANRKSKKSKNAR